MIYVLKCNRFVTIVLLPIWKKGGKTHGPPYRRRGLLPVGKPWPGRIWRTGNADD